MAHSGVTDYDEIQQNEIDALKSIFMEDFEEEKAKTGAWNKRADRSFKLKLWPVSGSTDHADDPELFAVLSVALPAAYPKQIPVCTIEFGPSVSQKVRNSIMIAVPEKARALIGNEAIYEISELIQEELDHAMETKAHTESLPALDQERVKHQREAAIEAESLRKAQLKASQHAQSQENAARLAAIGKETNAMFGNEHKPDTPLTSVKDAIIFDTEMRVRAPSGAILAFRTVRPATHLEDGPVSQVGYTSPADDHLTTDLPILSLKICELGRGWSESEIKAEISNTLEADLQAVMKLPGHRNLLPVLGFQIQATLHEPAKRTWIVHILGEHMKRGSLQAFMDVSGPLSVETFRDFIHQILEGMEFLHAHHLPHGRLSPENILLEKGRTGGWVVKITDILYQADLHLLKNPHATNFSTATSAYWKPPEFAESTTIRPTIAGDIWQLGIVMLQMLFGIDVQSHHSVPLKMLDEIPEINDQLENLMKRIFKVDPSRRPICFEIRGHTFIRENYPAVDATDSTALSIVSSKAAQNTPRVLRSRHGSSGQSETESGSRYTQDFAQLSRLGKGGYGSVYRVRNKLDGQEYAVKKIVNDSNDTLQTVLGEVMLLSRLYHPNIVRYVTAWIEKDRTGVESADEDTDDQSDADDSLLNRGSNFMSSQPSRSLGLDFISSNAGIASDEDSDDSGTEVESSDGSEDEDDFSDGLDPDDGVVFGEDTDTSKTSAVEQASSSPSTPKLLPKTTPRIRRRSSTALEPPTKITLYIQMEFCANQTLRHVIQSDISKNHVEYWRYLRQITSALAYVHGNGIIHRDLKPDNVFVSGSNVRLGDFGLAKPQVKERQRGRSAMQVALQTSSIGTSMYIAPEVRSSGGGTYDEKADMYSLGVILFEMCYISNITGMERAAILTDVRKEPPVLPERFEHEDMTLEKELILALVSHHPADRPSAADLLVRLPSEADDEAVNRRIDTALADENNPIYAKFLQQVLRRPPASREAKHYMYDIAQTQHYSNVDDAYHLSLIKDQLVRVFRRHEAVESTRQSFVPNTDHWTEAVQHIDASGQILHLPYDLTLPGARLLAKNGKIAPCNSYTIAPVYRRSDRTSQHPITSIEIDFDIISKDSLDPALREAEAIEVMDEVIDAVPALSARDMCFHINHCDLLDTILQACKVPEDRMRQVKDVISRLGHKSFAQIRTELRGVEVGISSTSAVELAQYDFRDTPEAAIKRLKALLGKNRSLEPTFAHLRALVKFTKNMQVKRKIYISPLSCHNAHFYAGSVMFQCLIESRKHRTVICAGGRYDQLIREHASDRSVSPCFAVGFQLSWESLAHIIQKYRRNTNKHKDDIVTSRRSDVLVCSNDAEILRTEGLSLLKELRSNDFCAGLSINAEDADALAYRGESSHDWIIHVKQEGMLRVRSMIRNDEDEIPRTEIISYLRSEMRERDRDRRTSERPRLHHSSASEPGNEGGRDQMVRVLNTQTRSKKSNRQNIVNRAQTCAATLTQKFRNGPIVAVDLKDDVFEMMRCVRIDDNESWRRVIQHADLNARHYMSQVHEELQDIAGMPQKFSNAFLFNFRSEACMLYDLTRSN